VFLPIGKEEALMIEAMTICGTVDNLMWESSFNTTFGEAVLS
jgi:hypothetical protein